MWWASCPGIDGYTAPTNAIQLAAATMQEAATSTLINGKPFLVEIEFVDFAPKDGQPYEFFRVELVGQDGETALFRGVERIDFDVSGGATKFTGSCVVEMQKTNVDDSRFAVGVG
jgi:hypothetical protein